MSNTVRYDPIIARYLAEELDARLRGRGCTAAPFFAPDLSVTLPLAGGEALRVDLHPSRGWTRMVGSAFDEEMLDAVCTGVSCPVDERRIIIDLDVVGRFRDQSRSLVLELQTNQLNAILIDRISGTIVNVLRGRRVGGRSLFPGQSYEPPEGGRRFGSDDTQKEEAEAAWWERLGFLTRTDARGAVLDQFAFTGTLNTGWILEAPDLDGAFERWWALRSLPPTNPVLVRSGETLHPYPFPLDGSDSEPTATLLEGMERIAALPDAPQQPLKDLASAEGMVRARIVATEKKLEKLRGQLDSAGGEAARIRSWGDLLLAKLHLVPRGESRVLLEDWEGQLLEIPLDPGLAPAENAARLYDQARRKQRAQEQLPALLNSAEKELASWKEALEKLSEGIVPDSILEKLRRKAELKTSGESDDSGLPYRVFRTSGGIEVRVGRSAKDNDRLTFHESSPNDVWMHAQSVPGSHVIMRWPNLDASPPGRDLEEAAQLAAVFSKARTSGLVAVDWTRRKHVRKPRGAAPGAVIPQRVRTVMVEPDEKVVERLGSG